MNVESVVADLRAIDHTTVWERTLAVGKVVLEGIFRGDVVEWRKRGNKSKSLRKLVGHPQCPFKKSALSVAVNAYLFAQDRPEVRGLANITPRHVSSVCSLPRALAFELLTTASADSWTIRELAERAQRLRRESGERRGRPPSGSSQHAETTMRRALRALQRMRALLDEGAELDEDSWLRLHSVIDSTIETCGQIRSLVLLGRPRRTLTLVRPSARGAEVERDTGTGAA